MDRQSPNIEERAHPDAGRVPFWLWPNLLSLDAPAVGLVWLWLFSACERLGFRWPIYLVFGGVVWCVYVADRLVDAVGPVSQGVETARLTFYRKYWGFFAMLLVAVSIFISGTILYEIPTTMVVAALPATVFVWFYFCQTTLGVSRIFFLASSVLAGVVAVSFVYQSPFPAAFRYLYIVACAAMIVMLTKQNARPRFFLLPKEFLCGIAFAAGIGVPVFTYASGQVVYSFWDMEILGFAVLCTLNCIGISICEREEDVSSSAISLVRQFPVMGSLYPLLLLLFILGVVVMFFGENLAQRWPLKVSLLAGGVGLGVVHLVRERISRPTYRVLADVALLGPAIFLPWFGR